MGSELAKLAYAASFTEDEHGTPLNMNERGVLAYMCVIANDYHEPPRYFGGRDLLARYALGRIVPPDDGSAEARKARHSIHESVRKALDGLASRGLIQRAGGGYPGRAQEYEIRLREWHSDQRQIGPISTPDWAISNEVLQMTRSTVGPKTKETNKTNERNQDHLSQAPHVRPVENGEAA